MLSQLLPSGATEIVLGEDVVIPVPPTHIEAFRQWADDMKRGAFAPNTVRLLHTGLRAFTAFCNARSAHVLPASVETVDQFVESMLDAGRRRSTIEAYLYAVGVIHDAADAPNPIRTASWRRRWRGFTASDRMVAAKASKTGLSFQLLQTLLAPMAASPRDLRDAALLRVAYDSLCRRSELCGLSWGDVSTHFDGSGQILVQRSKTDREGVGMHRYLRPETVDALERWAAAAGINRADGAADSAAGPVFVPIPRAREQRPQLAERLHPGQVARILKSRLRDAGVDPAAFAGHSARIGAAEDMVEAGIDLAQIMLAGGWRTSHQPVLYARKLNVKRGGMAALARAQGQGDKSA